MGKSFTDLSLKKLISLIKGDINKKQDKIEATGILTSNSDGTIAGLETLDASLVDLATVAETGSYNDLKDKPTIPTIPTKVSAFENDKKYLTAIPTASTSTLGGIKVDGSTITINNGVAKANGAFIVNINTSAPTLMSAESQLEADKTPEEIYQAFENNQAIYALVDNILYPLIAISNNNNYQFIFQLLEENVCQRLIYNGDNDEWSIETSTIVTSSDIPTKLPNPNNLSITVEGNTTTYNGSTAKSITIPQYATKTELSNATAGLTGAMHFIGSSTTAITDHGTQQPTVNGTKITSFNSGDVVLYNHLEFVWDGSKWEKLGDEGSYVLKTQKINGKALSGDITLNAADVGATTQSYVDTEINGVKESIPTKLSDLENDKVFKVTFSYSNGTYNADKTVSEVGTAINHNYYVYGILGNAIYNLSYFNNNNGMIIFSKIDYSGMVNSLRFSGNQIVYMTTNLQTIDNKISEITSTSTDYVYPSAKAVYNYVEANKSTSTIITWSDDGT